MEPVTKIMHFKTSSSYLEDPSRLISELTTTCSAGKIDGFSKAYLGFEVEDPTNAFWVFEWESLAAHDAYRQTETFKAIQATAQKIYTGQPKHVFVNFSDTSRIFSAPVTELVTSTLKEGVSMDKLEPLVTQFQAKLEGTPNFYGSSWAPVIDKPNVMYGVLGWESVQAHRDTVSSGPLKEIIDQVKEVADIWLVHAILAPSK
ncbi:uncharacterized protein F5147DRAFT_292298 [Suillus discolor]|uniref:ABM domain-containing protein n=1 Tax=Suillus discolor TaxID=1912936 RepID=A0A9P7F2Z1_9AGAM|nr:uncharacterized protein F5147DRAFT_292298 [Suillus discolor]KAG2102223.1 hypothetical protein F5147DRAFT_292298 [Suillus discolor]